MNVWSGELGEQMKEYIAEQGNFKIVGHMHHGALMRPPHRGNK